MEGLGFFNGEFIELQEGRLPLEDRGFQFGDGIYETVRVYRGKCFALDRHLERCRRSLRALRIPITYMDEELRAIHEDIIQKSGIEDGEIYFQITRGTAPRTCRFPGRADPSLAMVIRPMEVPIDAQEKGIRAILSEDIRWLRCDIPSLNLLGNVIAGQEAREKGAQEAILCRKATNTITEGTASNFFILREDVLWTHPLNHLVLNGITRALLLEECVPKLGLTVVEKAFSPKFAQEADEAFITSTRWEVAPVVKLGGKPIGDGRPGNVARGLLDAYRGLVRDECK